MPKQFDLIDYLSRFVDGGRSAQAAADEARHRAEARRYQQTQAEMARDAALTQVESHNETWLESALGVIAGMPSGHICTGEQIRHTVSEWKTGKPGHHNAWGALIMQAVKRGLLVPTGRYVKMKDKSSHARKTPEYRRT